MCMGQPERLHHHPLDDRKPSTINANNFKNRTSRSVFNNIIPHSTGANKSVTLLPKVKDRIAGVPQSSVNNVSIVDLVVTLNLGRQEQVTFDDVIGTLEASGFIEVNRRTWW